MKKIPPGEIILQKLKVNKPSELLEFLIENNVRKSRNAIKSLLAHKQLLVNGKLATHFDHKLNPNDRVEIMRYDQTRKVKKLPGLKIVYEDDHLIIVDKESGVLSVSTDKEKFKTVYNTLNEYTKNKKNQRKDARMFVLHRMDREISGLMIFGKSEEVQELFQRNWDLIVINYTYVGVIEGKLAKEEDTLTTWLTENKNFVVFSSPKDNGGLQAVTNYKTIKSNDRYSLVQFKQSTRRKNQIRAQMNQMQCPIVGDKKYGAPDSPIKRVALHGESMMLRHPITGDKMEFKSPVSRPMLQLVSSNYTKK